MKIERKISFTVAGIEFQNLKTAQFFARYIDNIRKVCDDQNKPELSARVTLGELYRLVSADVVNTDEELIEVVMGLQMPKPARKPTPKKKNIMNHETHEDALLFSPGFKNMDPAPGEREEPYFLSSNLTE